MMFNNALNGYLFILLLSLASVHLTVSQTDTTDFQSSVSPDDSLNISSSSNAPYTEPSTSSIFVENSSDTNTVLPSTSNEEAPTTISNTGPSTAVAQDLSTAIDSSTPTLESTAFNNPMSTIASTLSEEATTSYELTSNGQIGSGSSTEYNIPVATSEMSPASIITPSSSDLSTNSIAINTDLSSPASDILSSAAVVSSSIDLTSSSSDLTVNQQSTTLISLIEGSTISSGPEVTGSSISQTTNSFTDASSSTTLESSSNSQQPFSGTSEIIPTSIGAVLPESSTTDTATNNPVTLAPISTISQTYHSPETEESSTIAAITVVSITDFTTAYSPNSELTSSISKSTDTGGAYESTASLIPTQISVVATGDTTDAALIMTASTISEAAQQSTPATPLINTQSTDLAGTLPTNTNIDFTTASIPISFVSIESTPAISKDTSAVLPVTSNTYPGPTGPSAISGETAVTTTTTTTTTSPTSTTTTSSTSTTTTSPTSTTTTSATFTTTTSASSTTTTSATSTTTTSASSTTTTTSSTSTTTTTITTTPSPFIPVRPLTVDYEVTQTINSISFGISTKKRVKVFQLLEERLQPELITSLADFIQWLRGRLEPELTILVYNGTQTISKPQFTIVYIASYRGYGDPSETRIERYIQSQTQEYSLLTTVIPRNASCPNDQPTQQQQNCYYCGTESPCANLPESTCVLTSTDDTQNYFCKCDRTKHFFKTNYEYDEKCGRTSMPWWPQILVLAFLILFVLILLFALLMFCRRRHNILSKNAKREPEVLSNAPQKTSDFEYIELNNQNQLPYNYISTYSNPRQPVPIYSADRSNDYVYRRRAPQNYTYPSHTYPYVQRGLPPTFRNETNGQLGVLDNSFYHDQGTNQRFDVYRGNDDDDEIFV